jgi:hypothetical protein
MQKYHDEIISEAMVLDEMENTRFLAIDEGWVGRRGGDHGRLDTRRSEHERSEPRVSRRQTKCSEK